MISINIKSTNKKELLRYLCQKAELCAFHLPVFLCENKEEEEEYKRRVSGLLDGIQPYIVAQYTASQYIGLDYGDETEIYVFKSNKFFADFLESSGGLHKWSYPKLPEDVCFLDKNRKCWLKTVTHEKECYLFDEKEEDFNVLNQCRVKYDVLDHWYAWKPSYLETEEELTEIKDKTTRKKQEIRLRGDYAVNFFQQHLEGKNFIKLGNTFVKLADDSFAVLLEVDAEFDDISLYYGVIPMCMNFDPDIEFDLQFSIDLCDMREKTDEKCLEVFYENIFSKLIELESLTDVWNFLWKEYDEEYHENAKKEDCLNEDMMYCALELGNYSSALDYICNEIKLGMADKDELKVLKRLRKMLKHQQFEDIQDVLKRNKSLWKKEFDDRMMKF